MKRSEFLEKTAQNFRNPQMLRHPRCRKSAEQIARYLRRNWREEHLFNLTSALRLFDTLEDMIALYDAARDAATAATIIGQLNTHGTRIRSVYVTFDPQGPFATAIAGVTLNDGRPASAVIRNVGGHATHFHWEVTDN